MLAIARIYWKLAWLRLTARARKWASSIPGIVKFSLGVAVAVFTIYTTEIAKQAMHARTVASQLDAQLRVYAEKFEEYPGLQQTLALAHEWHEKRARALKQTNGASDPRGVDDQFRGRIEALASAALSRFMEEQGKLKRTPILLDAVIAEFEKEELDMRNNITILPDSEAANLGPDIAYHVVEFRQHNRDAYSALALLSKYMRHLENSNPAEVAPYFQLYFRSRVKAYRAYIALRERVDPLRGMGLMDFSLRPLANGNVK
jgi:hypothetical protein